MKQSHEKLLIQFASMAKNGSFGDDIRQASKEYDHLPGDIPVMLKLVHEFNNQLNSDNSELRQAGDLVCQMLIGAYREANRKDPKIAAHFVDSFVQDYPGVPESCLLPKWTSLGNASLAFREVAHSQNSLIVWQQSLKLCQAYNEFLNGLFGYLIILWRVKLGKSVNPNILNTTYANKVTHLGELTGGEDGPFYLLLRLAQPDIRNAVAHESIWLDSDASVVRYVTGSQNKQELELDLVQFMTYSSLGSHIAQPYLVAIALIAVMEFGNEHAKSLLPERYRRVLTHT